MEATKYQLTQDFLQHVNFDSVGEGKKQRI